MNPYGWSEVVGGRGGLLHATPAFMFWTLRFMLLLVLSPLFGGCAAPRLMGPGVPRHYAQAMDSATSACLRNPSCYVAPPGEDAIIPGLARALEAVRTVSAVVRLLEAAEVARVEQVLKDCANEASLKVNEQWLGKGNRPTRQLCQQTYETDARGNKVTWAMHLGREKHRVALECVQRELGAALAEHVSLQPQYRYYRTPRTLELLDPRQVAEWLRDGLYGMLLGTLIPDVVVHAAGNPLHAQAVFDFKFPCPSSNPPTWNSYPENHPFHELDQGGLYQEAFNLKEAVRISPGYGGSK